MVDACRSSPVAIRRLVAWGEATALREERTRNDSIRMRRTDWVRAKLCLIGRIRGHSEAEWVGETSFSDNGLRVVAEDGGALIGDGVGICGG